MFDPLIEILARIVFGMLNRTKTDAHTVHNAAKTVYLAVAAPFLGLATFLFTAQHMLQVRLADFISWTRVNLVF